MEDAPRLAILDRKAAEPLAVVPAAIPPWEQVRRQPHLLDYLIILRKHQWLILTFLLVVVTVATIATFKMKPVYEASGRVEVDKESQNILPFQGGNYAYDEYEDMENYIDTQVKILQSETLAFQTIKSLDLGRYPEFGGTPGVLAPSREGSERPAILGAFLGRLTVARVPNSRLVEVTFAAEDPHLAALVVNTHVQNYLEQNFRSKYDATTQASGWLSSELEELRNKVQESENARIAYERQNQIWLIDDKQDITTQKLAQLSTSLTQAEAALADKEATYRMATTGNLDTLTSIRDNAVVQDLTKRSSDLEQQYADALNQYGPNFPKVQRLAAQRKEVEDDLEKARRVTVAAIQQDYETARTHVQILQEALDKQKQEANQESERLVQYHILQHDADTNKQLYDGLQQKLKEAGITAGLRASNIRVVDPALTPASPSRPQRARNILLAVLIGLVGGIGLAVFREYLDNTVKSPDDIETLTGLPSLAVVPSVPALNGHYGQLSRVARPDAPGSRRHVELLAHIQPKSQISEAFRGLRTSLLLSQAEHPPQTILVTSALPREGKTTAAVNLAVTLAQLGDKTLLIDADLRKPGIRRALDLSTGKKDSGLSSYLAGVCSLDEIVVSHPSIGNLTAVTTGPIPPSPADLLSSYRMREAITELRRRYKFIVIDSPPIMAATDAVILSAVVDGVLLVVRSGSTPKEAFTRTRDLLAAVKCRLLGVVLNAVDSSAPDYYYSYRYYPYAYGYDYGEQGDTKTKVVSGSGDAITPEV